MPHACLPRVGQGAGTTFSGADDPVLSALYYGVYLLLTVRGVTYAAEDAAQQPPQWKVSECNGFRLFESVPSSTEG